MASIRSWLSAVICLLPSASLAATLLASHYSGTIYTLDLEVTNGNGTLKVKSTGKAGVTQPAWITFDSEDRILYVNDENWRGRPGGMSALSVKEDGSVTLAASAQTSGGQVHSTLYGGSNGRGFIATTEYDLSTLTTYQLPLTASTQPVEKLKFTMSGRGPNAMRQDRPHPHSVWTDPTGKFLLSADLGADLVRIYRIDATTGKLTECPAAQTGPGDGPRHGAWWAPKAGSTEGLMLYVVNELANSVTVWQTAYPSGDGGCLSLKKTQSAPTYPAGKTAPQGSKAAEVRVAGNFVYASNRNDRTYGAKEDSMATYSIDAASGAIKFLEQTSAHGWFPRTFVINKAGDMVAIGGQTSANVAVVARDVQSGKLGELIATIPLGSPGTVNNEDGLSAVIWDE